MNEHIEPSYPYCGKQIIDTRATVQPYNDFDDYAGFRCSGCKETFTDDAVASLRKQSEASEHD